jgi:hypothetical protein
MIIIICSLYSFIYLTRQATRNPRHIGKPCWSISDNLIFMKSLLYFLCIILLFVSGVCRRTCDGYTATSINGPIEDYFGVYKPGNWWVYQNKDGTKKDSIYITDYSDQHLQDRTSCFEYEQRSYTIKSNILENGGDLYVLSNSDQVSVGINFSLIKNQTQSGGFPQFIYDSRQNKISSFPEPDNQGQNTFATITINNVTYNDILQGKYGNSVYYFSKDRGLVGWTINGETFNLTNDKIL